MENEKETIVFNPCKYCLKRPVCKKQCDDLKNHIETQEIGCVLILFIVITGLWIYGIVYIYTHYPIKIVACILSLILGVSYGYTIKEIITQYLEEFKEYKFIKKFFAILLGPTSMVAAWLFYNFDFDDIINKYSKRYFLKG